MTYDEARDENPIITSAQEPNPFKPGDRVVYAGRYEGTIVEVCDWDRGLVVIALRSGRTCASWRWCSPTPEN